MLKNDAHHFIYVQDVKQLSYYTLEVVSIKSEFLKCQNI